MAEAAAKRRVFSSTTVLRVTWGALVTVRAFIFQAVDTKMPCDVVLRTREHCFLYFNRPIFMVTWTGNTHKETDVLPSHRQSEGS